MTDDRFWRPGEGKATIRILAPAPSHEFTFSAEEIERRKKMVADCPLCKAGIPLGDKRVASKS